MKATGYLKISLLALAVAASAQAAPPESQRATFEEYSSGLQPGCAMGVFGTGPRAQYKMGGYADIAARVPITENTRFLAASTSKQFTALAILHLAADRRLDLRDPARRWVPELGGAVQDATIEQLLHQTAGVRDHISLLYLSSVEVLGSVDRAATHALMARQRNTNFPPGTRSSYSNGNYFILSEIVARASGQPLERYAERVLFAPLQMANTQFLSEQKPALAQGYSPNDRSGFDLANDRPATNGSGGLITSIADLRKFDADFRSEKIVWRRGIKRQMLTPGRLNNGQVAILPEFQSPYGMGVGLAEEQGDTLVSHDGGAEGFRAEYSRLLNRGISVAVLCNRSDANASSIADQALRAAAGLGSPIAQAKTPGPVFVDVPRQTLEAIAGTYRSDELDAVFVFKPSEDGFEVTVTSPFTPTPSVGTWGGLRLADTGQIHSGPARITPLGIGGSVDKLLLGFGRRVEGVELKRIAAQRP